MTDIFQMMLDSTVGITKFSPGDRVCCKVSGVTGTVVTFREFLDRGAGEFADDDDGTNYGELVVWWDKYNDETPRRFNGVGPYTWDAALEAIELDEGSQQIKNFKVGDRVKYLSANSHPFGTVAEENGKRVVKWDAGGWMGPYCWDAILAPADEPKTETAEPEETEDDLPFDVGSVVALKSGGPAMTINARIESEDDDGEPQYEFECMWFSGGDTPEVHSYTFGAYALVPA